ncbi:MAG: hypothetical protein COS07_02290 [Candidatus Aenigmarchaeota archaeon CG01_land_8_20_14_3_00_37_9]|nr:MAG: hypothetical protein COS07_02290 [Candidatus Aenigmarchaeota archaeon CG01_land_8_20_14_3_00_37_9]
MFLFNVGIMSELCRIHIHGSIANSEYRSINGVSHKTAHEDLIDLVEKGILSKEWRGRATYYAFRLGDD